MIRTEMGTHNRSEMVTLHGTPCAIPTHKSISKNFGHVDRKPEHNCQVLMEEKFDNIRVYQVAKHKN
jgi:hypothetical protein